MTGFSENQLKKLNRPVDSAHIYKRTREGREFSYIPAWWAIAEANAIFGHAGWDRQTVHLEKLFDRSTHAEITCAYSARVRITVRAGETNITREGTGFGFGACRMPADAHERAVKAAETDATKRALATFGDRLGLCLYRTDRFGTNTSTKPVRLALTAPDGTLLDAGLSPEGFAGGLRQLIEKAEPAETVDNLIMHNAESLRTLKIDFANLTNRGGRHYADILLELAEGRKIFLAENNMRDEKDNNALAEGPSIGSDDLSPAENHASLADMPLPVPIDRSGPASTLRPLLYPANPSRIGFGARVDKSILNYALERRIRNKEHLSHVGAQPCLVCTDTPCHAHHITFAQPRGLSVKVSDEFTVPLCAIHHNQLHQSRPEKAWWNNQGIEPLKTATALWEETLRRLTAHSA